MRRIASYVLGRIALLYAGAAAGAVIFGWVRSGREPAGDLTIAGPEEPLQSVPGAWYPGIRCSRCGEMIPILTDASRGQGPIRFDTDNSLMRQRCSLGHLTEFPADQMSRFQAT